MNKLKTNLKFFGVLLGQFWLKIFSFFVIPSPSLEMTLKIMNSFIMRDINKNVLECFRGVITKNFRQGKANGWDN